MTSFDPETCETFLHPVRADQPAMADRLVRWANQNSGSLNAEGLSAMQDLVRDAFSVLPGRMEVIELPTDSPAGSCGILRIVNRPEAPIQILLNGHLDTVFGPDSPFQECLVLDSERIRGPGISDMKGGLVVMLAALRAFESCPWRDRIGWEVMITPDEELGSPHSTPFLQAAARRHHIAMIFESSLPDGQLIRARMGVGAYRFMVRGRSAHVGRNFEAGRNAIDALAGILLKASDLNRSMEGVIVNVGRVEGGGPINVVPDRAVADLNVRVWRKEQMADLEARLRACGSAIGERDGYEVEFSGGFSCGPKEVNPEVEALFGAFCDCGRSIGLSFGWRDTGGGSDGNILAMEGLPNIDSLGVRGEFIHSDREYILVDSLVERASLSALFLMRLARGDLRLPAAILDRSIEPAGERGG